MMEELRDVIIRTDEAVKYLRENFERHQKDGESKYRELLKSAALCPESSHIEKQNGKIDRLIALVTKIENKQTVTWSGLVRAIVTIGGIVAISFGVMSYFNKSHGEEVQSCPAHENIKVSELVKLFNNSPASKQLGFTFGCTAPDIETPTLQLYTHTPHNLCIQREVQLKYIVECISADWEAHTKSKMVNVYDKMGRLIYYTNLKGEFLSVDEVMI